jgi:hypothetical protein
VARVGREHAPQKQIQQRASARQQVEAEADATSNDLSNLSGDVSTVRSDSFTRRHRCHPWTREFLQPQLIHATRQTRIGKETNQLLDTNDSTPSEPAIEYPTQTSRGCPKWCSDACRRSANRRRRR